VEEREQNPSRLERINQLEPAVQDLITAGALGVTFGFVLYFGIQEETQAHAAGSFCGFMGAMYLTARRLYSHIVGYGE
jgi:hypothetical protein